MRTGCCAIRSHSAVASLMALREVAGIGGIGGVEGVQQFVHHRAMERVGIVGAAQRQHGALTAQSRVSQCIADPKVEQNRNSA